MSYPDTVDQVDPSDLQHSLQILVRLIVSEYRKSLETKKHVPSPIPPRDNASTPQCRLLGVNGLAAYLSIPKATIYTLVSMRKIPQKAIVHIGRSLKFDVVEIDTWWQATKAAN